DADRVVVLLARFALEDGATVADLDRAHPHRHRDRRRWHLAGDDRFHVLDAGHRRAGRRRRQRVLPDQLTAAGYLGLGLGKGERRLDRAAALLGYPLRAQRPALRARTWPRSRADRGLAG